MNTIRSTWIGWGTLCVAGGGAYYFAKKSINADRASRFEAETKKKAQLAAMEAEHRRQSPPATNKPITAPMDDPAFKRASQARFQNAADDVASPSEEASHDPAPTRHEPETEQDRLLEKGKYEAARPFRPPPGNRL
ncbi:uncharacterized protein BDV17DRAFT_232870 [Aspergillus undulatus]|uniref:uncharacterized protein n=1 Tax=Aspergillus undulatus TaxID=1810928 RepID=UPI003CCDE123